MDKILNVFPNLREHTGEIGFEIEVEGRYLPELGKGEEYWRRVRDGSLLGAENGEYIFAKPLTLLQSKAALDHLKKLFIQNKTVVDDSVRAGIHVHLNAQRMNMIQVYNLVTLYLILEEILVSEQVCGKGREGNLFCLRASDAEYLTYYLSEVARKKRWQDLMSDDIRYASINLKALAEMGSVEFRAMRTTTDFDAVYKWIRTLYSLRESAKMFDTPDDIIRGFSEAEGPNFMQMVLGDLAKPYLKIPDLGIRIKNGMRNAQDIAFCIDWKAYSKELEAVRKSSNPFLSAQVRGDLHGPVPAELRRNRAPRLEGELVNAAPRIRRPAFPEELRMPGDTHDDNGHRYMWDGRRWIDVGPVPIEVAQVEEVQLTMPEVVPQQNVNVVAAQGVQGLFWNRHPEWYERPATAPQDREILNRALGVLREAQARNVVQALDDDLPIDYNF